MITIPGYHIKEQQGRSTGVGDPLFESDHSVIYQGIRQSDNHPIVLKILKQSDADLNEAAKFRSEYEITASLQGTGFIEAYGLESHQNQWVMVLEDFGGESLADMIQNHLSKLSKKDAHPVSRLPIFEVEEFLRITIRLTEILSELHQQNITHKNLNPSNILYNAQTKQIKLIDFGISTSLSRESSPGLPPTILEGTLLYMSPEQTGRMNRALDYRTDFYSLGATFYEMLTGRPPFQAEDAMELVHCHLAKLPVLPHQLKSEIPVFLSEIVMKLMAKHAEDRYQSTFGLKRVPTIFVKFYTLRNGRSSHSKPAKIPLVFSPKRLDETSKWSEALIREGLTGFS